MKYQPKPRPDFKDPPLDEVVCGVQLDNAPWNDLMYGQFYDQVLGGDSGPFKLDGRQPQLPPIGAGGPAISFDMVGDPPRIWLVERESPYLIQLQPRRFLLNWRRLEKTYAYPRFFPTEDNPKDTIWDRFVIEFGRYADFLAKVSGNQPKVTACELTYINHFVHGEEWDDVDNFASRFTLLSGLKKLEAVKGVAMTALYNVHDTPLRIQVRKARRHTDQKQLFVVEFDIKSELVATQDLEQWFIDANHVITSEFVRLTTDDAHSGWGKKKG